MTLLDAQDYDPAAERRRRVRIITAVALVLLLAGLAFAYRNWPEERVANQFFDALEHRDYEGAYGIWMHDPQWKQHVERHSQYPFSEFHRDWGPGGEWGLIQSYHIYASGTPKGGGSGVVVEVVVNDRAEHARVWVEKSDKSLSFSPY
jgi:hypothetical protein